MRKKRTLTEEHKTKISIAVRGKKKTFSDQAIENIRVAARKRKGVKKGPHTEETKQKIRDRTLGKKKILTKENPTSFKQGNKPAKPFKKGLIPWNIGLIYGKARNTRNGQYKKWRDSVLKRDNYKCCNCDSSENLHAHHIIPWKEDESKRFEVPNGKTLCKSCHMKEEKTGIKNGMNTRFKKGHKGFKKVI